MREASRRWGKVCLTRAGLHVTDGFTTASEPTSRILLLRLALIFLTKECSFVRLMFERADGTTDGTFLLPRKACPCNQRSGNAARIAHACSG